MGVSAATGFGDLHAPAPVRLWQRAPSVAARARPAGVAEGALVMAALQPLIERQGSLIVHLIGAERGCGTTHVAHAVARAAARHAWCRTLLIDASRLASDGRSDVPGPDLLSAYTAGGSPTGSPALAGGEAGFATAPLTGAGAGIPRLAELRMLYATLRAQFSLVLVDCPPVADAPDTAILSCLADQSILVVRAERSRAGAVAAADQLLEQAGVGKLGVVLNGHRRRVPAFLDRLL